MALVVLEQKVISIPPNKGFREDRDLTAASRGVDHVSWHRIPCGVTSQPRDNLYTFFYGSSEMGRSQNGVTLIQIVGLDPYPE
jgi:hypothetical protein